MEKTPAVTHWRCGGCCKVLHYQVCRAPGYLSAPGLGVRNSGAALTNFLLFKPSVALAGPLSQVPPILASLGHLFAPLDPVSAAATCVFQTYLHISFSLCWFFMFVYLFVFFQKNPSLPGLPGEFLFELCSLAPT